MKFTNPEVLNRVGIKTPQAVIYKSESHKLHQAFPVKKTEGVVAVVIPGMPVQINTDGTIEPYIGDGIYIGIAMTDSLTPAYPEGALGPEVTVAVEAFAVTYGVAGEALECGYVGPDALANDDDLYVPYLQSDEATKFINITPEAEEGDLVQILIR